MLQFGNCQFCVGAIIPVNFKVQRRLFVDCLVGIVESSGRTLYRANKVVQIKISAGTHTVRAVRGNAAAPKERKTWMATKKLFFRKKNLSPREPFQRIYIHVTTVRRMEFEMRLKSV